MDVPPCAALIRVKMVPWLNWIEQPPPKGQVAGSNPAGITSHAHDVTPQFQKYAILKAEYIFEGIENGLLSPFEKLCRYAGLPK